MVSFGLTIHEICEKIPSQSRDRDEYIALGNLAAFINDLLERNKRNAKDDRDTRMADNLKWLMNSKFPGSKIIVWAANTHIMKNALTSFQKRSLNISTLGTSFTREKSLSDQTYILGFTSSTGESQTVMQRTPFKIEESTGGFENWIAGSIDFGFVDFRKFKNIQPDYKDFFILKARGHSPVKARWTDIFDGIFYIRRMQPAHVKRNVLSGG